jgi:hypothetical protein
MALIQTRRQGLKQDSLTNIVSTSGGSTDVNRRTSTAVQLRARGLAGSGVARARSINTKLTLKIKKKNSRG